MPVSERVTNASTANPAARTKADEAQRAFEPGRSTSSRKALDIAVMPDLCTPTRATRHTIDSAIPALLRLGVGIDRIVIRSAGGGWRKGTVIWQKPAPAQPLQSRTRVILGIAGFGAMESLPFPMRDEDDREFRADRLLGLCDNPTFKLGHFLREAAGYYVLRPDDPITSRRWIEDIFRIDAGSWPPELWYPIARLLPALHRYAGRSEAVPLAFQLLFQLPVSRIRLRARAARISAGQETRLGERNARLGLDMVAGTALRTESAVEILFGPVDLATYLMHTAAGQRQRRDALYHLLLPHNLNGNVTERWLVGDPARGARFDDSKDPPVLGVNAYLGAAASPHGDRRTQ